MGCFAPVAPPALGYARGSVQHPAEITALALRELPARDGLLGPFEALRARTHPWLLDSALPSPRLGRWSLAGADPYWIASARGSRVELRVLRAARAGLAPGRQVLHGDPLDVVRELLPAPPARVSGDAGIVPPFAGGAVGYLGYELARFTLPVRLGGIDDLGLPDLVLLFVDRVLAFDHHRRVLLACGLGFGADADEASARARQARDALVRQLDGASPEPASAGRVAPAAPPFAFFDESTYAKAVLQVKEQIAAGNVYQACLTHRMERDCPADPWTLYRRLRRENPAPFASYLELPDVTVVGSSPERFLRLSPGRQVESRPIKGTRPRGRTPAEDAALRRELERSEKDRAENLMIVDLVRNDLGRVCETGSVTAPERMAIEAHASVFQMVSTVRGRLRADRDAIDLVRAAFPPGSMTGAPKIAAVRILDHLEPVRRGIYAGAIGYLDARGGADLSVVIRTLLVRRGRAYLHAGGGIVADSDPVAEYRETLDKARPLAAVLGAVRNE